MRSGFASDAQVNSQGFAERLGLFLEVASAAGFSAAGRKRGLAPSSVARQIDALERELGVRLFHRSTRLITLTDAGDALREKAALALASLEDARNAVSALQTEPRGRLRIAAPTMFGRTHVVPLIVRFLARYPRVEIEVRLEDAFVGLVEERIDLAIRIGELRDSTLVATRIAPQRRVACASPEYLQRMGTPSTPLDLANHECLTTPGQPLKGWWMFDGKRLPAHGRLLCQSSGALLDAALEGAGIVHLPSWLVGPALRAGKLVRLFPDRPLAADARSIFLLRIPGTAPPKVRTLIRFLKRGFGQPPFWDTDLTPPGPWSPHGRRGSR
jgi:DNA-binding transcriptional LysR family regulator